MLSRGLDFNTSVRSQSGQERQGSDLQGCEEGMWDQQGHVGPQRHGPVPVARAPSSQAPRCPVLWRRRGQQWSASGAVWEMEGRVVVRGPNYPVDSDFRQPVWTHTQSRDTLGHFPLLFGVSLHRNMRPSYPTPRCLWHPHNWYPVPEESPLKSPI